MLDKRDSLNIAIIGASGAIGSQFVEQLSSLPKSTIHAFSRSGTSFAAANIQKHYIDITDEASIENAAGLIATDRPIDIVIVATGILHNADIMPEKSIRDLTTHNFDNVYAINTIGPALIAKHFLPYFRMDAPSLFAALSARVGSISDNQLGGWYAYRASKAALNMVLKNLSVETKRRLRESIIVGLHPGTVASQLSAPFQSNVPEGQLFSPSFAVQKLISVLETLTPEDSGKIFAWDGSVIEY